MHSQAFDLSHFSLGDMTRCGVALRRIGGGAESMEEVAARTVRYLYEALRESSRRAPACALVRLFVTMPYRSLEPDQRTFARSLLGREPESGEMKCLTLLASAGEEPAWNSRRSSTGHMALPLPSAEAVARSPMIAQLMRQLGVELDALLSSDLMIDEEQHTFNVFHVERALGSPYIPAQEVFVVPYGVRSVLGFGGLLPSGELFATILFSRSAIARDAADLFKTLALNVKVALLPFAARRIFA